MSQEQNSTRRSREVMAAERAPAEGADQDQPESVADRTSPPAASGPAQDDWFLWDAPLGPW